MAFILLVFYIFVVISLVYPVGTGQDLFWDVLWTSHCTFNVHIMCLWDVPLRQGRKSFYLVSPQNVPRTYVGTSQRPKKT